MKIETQNLLIDNMFLKPFVVILDATNGVYVEFKRFPLEDEIKIYQAIINLKPDQKEAYIELFNYITNNYSKHFTSDSEKGDETPQDNIDTIASVIALWYHRTQEFTSNEDLHSLYHYETGAEKQKQKEDKRNILLELDIYRIYTESIQHLGMDAVKRFNLNFLSLMLKVIEIKTYQQTLSDFRLQSTVAAMAYGGDYKEYVDDLIHYSMGEFSYKELKKEIQKDIKEQRELMQTIATQYEEKLKDMKTIEMLAFIKNKMKEVNNERVSK